MKTAYATTLCNGDSYAPGVETLGKSLKARGTQVPMVAMVTEDVSREARARLVAQGWKIRDVSPILNPSTSPLFPRFDNVFTKLRAWELTEFDKVVFLDADTLVLQNIDELFDRPEIAAAPDFFMPDRFNSGVMVLVPSPKTFGKMVQALASSGSYDGGDQGFLNNYFESWYAMSVEHRLPAGYNMHHFVYQFLRAHSSVCKELDKEIKIIHYTLQKPWIGKPTFSGGAEVWWKVYFEAHPEKDAPWKHALHNLEDWSFDRVVAALAS
ncbi:MAG: glycosyltransferase family 8 protein [Minicystis sp.]